MYSNWVPESDLFDEDLAISPEDSEEIFLHELDDEDLLDSANELSSLQGSTYYEITGILDNNHPANDELTWLMDNQEGYMNDDISTTTWSAQMFVPYTYKLSYHEVEYLKKQIRVRLDLLVNERKRKEEQIRNKKVMQERIPVLLNSIEGYRAWMEVFFRKSRFRLFIEENRVISWWEIWKFIVLFHPYSSLFEVIVWKSRGTTNNFPSSLKEAESLTSTNEMPSWAWMHRDISRDSLNNASRFWGWNFIALSPSHILVWGQSGDFGDFPEEIVRKAFEQAWIEITFLDNRTNISLSQVFNQIKRHGLDRVE